MEKPPSPSSIDADLVKQIAFLVRLGIKDQEARQFSQQLTRILEYFKLLNECDTTEIPPASQVAARNNIFREDVEIVSMSRDEFLNNAPHHDGAYLKVPHVFKDNRSG